MTSLRGKYGTEIFAGSNKQKIQWWTVGQKLCAEQFVCGIWICGLVLNYWYFLPIPTQLSFYKRLNSLRERIKLCPLDCSLNSSIRNIFGIPEQCSSSRRKKLWFVWVCTDFDQQFSILKRSTWKLKIFICKTKWIKWDLYNFKNDKS